MTDDPRQIAVAVTLYDRHKITLLPDVLAKVIEAVDTAGPNPTATLGYVMVNNQNEVCTIDPATGRPVVFRECTADPASVEAGYEKGLPDEAPFLLCHVTAVPR